MSVPFDQLLIAPTHDRLCAMIEEATRAVHVERMHARGLIREWLERVDHEREGKDVFRLSISGRRGERYAGLAWWTDHQGRRHVRIFSGNTADSRLHPHAGRQDDDLRPPLWHVHPERIFRVERPGRASAWLVSCACGATGHPADLAWMGPCCGPCHDRSEEVGVPLHPPPAVLEVRNTVYGLALTPDTTRLAISMADRRLVLRDLVQGGEIPLEEGSADLGYTEGHLDFRALDISQDGAFLAVGDPHAQTIRVWPLEDTGTAAELPLPDDHDTLISGLEFSSDGKFLAACTDGACLSVYDRAQDWREVHNEVRAVTALHFLPDARTLAVGGHQGRIRLLDTTTWVRRGQIDIEASADEDVLFLGCPPTGAVLVALLGSLSPVGQRSQQLILWDLPRAQERSRIALSGVSSLVMSPDGRFLARVHHDVQHSPAVISFWDVERWCEAGSLEWDTEDSINTLAFSPDGQILAAGTWMGRVVLFPWRLLLEA